MVRRPWLSAGPRPVRPAPGLFVVVLPPPPLRLRPVGDQPRV